MTRVLHVTECFSSGVSGALRTIVELSPEHEHHLLYAGLEDPARAGFASVRLMPDSPFARVQAVRTRAREIEADVVHAHSSWAGMYARVLPPRTRVIYQPHGYRVNDPQLARPLGLLYGAAERALGMFTDTAVVLTPQEERLARRFSPKAHIVMVPNAPTLTAPPAVEAAEGGGAPKVIMIGRVSPQKDPDYFTEVTRLVRAERPEVRFVWVGDAEPGGDAAGVRKLTAAGVEVTGWADTSTLQQHLASASLYLHTASYEGFPLSVLDGAAIGAPIAVREIAAFENTPLRTVRTPAEAARLTLAAIDDPAVADDLRARARALLVAMNGDTQRAALKRLYARDRSASAHSRANG